MTESFSLNTQAEKLKEVPKFDKGVKGYEEYALGRLKAAGIPNDLIYDPFYRKLSETTTDQDPNTFVLLHDVFEHSILAQALIDLRKKHPDLDVPDSWTNFYDGNQPIEDMIVILGNTVNYGVGTGSDNIFTPLQTILDWTRIRKITPELYARSIREFLERVFTKQLNILVERSEDGVFIASKFKEDGVFRDIPVSYINFIKDNMAEFIEILLSKYALLGRALSSKENSSPGEVSKNPDYSDEELQDGFKVLLKNPKDGVMNKISVNELIELGLIPDNYGYSAYPKPPKKDVSKGA